MSSHILALQVYHDVREAPFEKRPAKESPILVVPGTCRKTMSGAIFSRLPPESLKDLRDILGRRSPRVQCVGAYKGRQLREN